MTGQSVCSITSASDQAEQGRVIVTEHFSCTDRASDPRASGSVEADFVTTFEPAAATSARWEGTVTVTNADGTWSGRAKGALVFWPGEAGPHNYGEGTYTGSGEYEGLVYHQIVSGSDSGLVFSGWIEPGR